MATKGKVLIVDDDKDFSKTTKMILLAGGYEVATASDGKEGLRKITEVQPDVVLVDIMMESMFEGFSFMAALRTGDEYASVESTPVIMVSSVKADTGSRFSFGDEEGMGEIPSPDAYMDKPLKPKELLDKIAALIQKS
jgi:CheY-like chemotaxis protein